MGGKGGGSPEVEQAPTMTPGQMALLDSLSGLIQGQLGKGVEAYPGEMTSGPSGLQQQYFDLVSKIGSGTAANQAESQNALSSLIKPWEASGATDYWNQAIKDPAMLAWQDQIMPTISEKFAAYDALGGGGSQKAMSDAGAKLTTQMAAQLQDYLMKDKELSNAQMMQAAGLSQGLNAQNAAMLGQAGETQRGITNEQLMEGYKKWAYSQPYNNPWLQYMGTTLNAQAFENIVSAPQQDQTGQYVAAAASAAAMAASSDERLKEDIKSIDPPLALAKVERMRPVSYRWRDVGRVDVGFIAQEMQQVVPEVIVKMPNEYLGIDYPKLTSMLAGAVQELARRVRALEGGDE